MSNPETKVQRQILDYLERRRILSWRNNSGILKIGNRLIYLAPKGSPDIIGVLPNGRFFGCEVKMQREGLTLDQSAFHKKLRDNGALVFVARNIDDVARALREAGI